MPGIVTVSAIAITLVASQPFRPAAPDPWGQDGHQGTVFGAVVDGCGLWDTGYDHVVDPPAEVKLRGVHSGTVRTTTTDAHGRFSFKNLVADTYWLETPGSAGTRVDLTPGGTKEDVWVCRDGAETAHSADALRSLGVGRKVTVTLVTGQRVQGRLAGFSPSSLDLELETGGSRQEIDFETVAFVEGNRRFRWQEGLGMGAFLPWGLSVLVQSDEFGLLRSPRRAAAITAISGAIGAVVAGLSTRPVLVYRRPDGSERDVRVSPLIGPSVRGAAVSIRWANRR